jgi:hypothetical protein
LVREKIEAARIPVAFPETFIRAVEWDIMMLLTEADHSDLVKPAFYAVLGFYYIKGHFPCGWEGNFPQGRLIVY